MATAAHPLIHVRSYGADSTVDRHDFAQIVLPLAGQLSMDIAGHEAVVDRSTAAYVEAGARHDQVSRHVNRALILDLPQRALEDSVLERLALRPYRPLDAEAGSLVDYMGHVLARGAMAPQRLALWLPLLIDALLGDAPRPRSRLAGLVAAIEAAPGRAWSVETMGAHLGLSASRVHALFQQELGQTPHAWLSALRLARVRQLLAGSALPIAEIALRHGYADQSALTRAMRHATGTTPAAYRRQAGEQAQTRRDADKTGRSG